MKMQPVIWLLIVVSKGRRMQDGKVSKKKDGFHGPLATQNHYLLRILTLFL